MNNETILFILTTVMEIATLACAYLGLRLFKKNKWFFSFKCHDYSFSFV